MALSATGIEAYWAFVRRGFTHSQALRLARLHLRYRFARPWDDRPNGDVRRAYVRWLIRHGRISG